MGLAGAGFRKGEDAGVLGDDAGWEGLWKRGKGGEGGMGAPR